MKLDLDYLYHERYHSTLACDREKGYMYYNLSLSFKFTISLQIANKKKEDIYACCYNMG